MTQTFSTKWDAGGVMPKSSRLVVVANRLPISRAPTTGKSPQWVSSSGGLVTALVL